jgi:UDP-glucose 4-epimerase
MPSPEAPLVLVTGATGAVGPAVVARMLAEGMRVRTLTRHAPAPGVLPPTVEAQAGDIADASARARALHGVDRVLHLAGLLHITNPDGQAAADYDGPNAAAAGALGRESLAAGVSRFVLFSTIAVYGDTSGAIVTEDTRPAPATPYARSKLGAERAVLDLRRDGAPIGVVLRLAAVYGPRVKGNYRSLVRYLASGRPMPVLPGANRRTLVFDEDVARAAALASSHPAAAGRVYNVTDGAIHTLEQITSAICAALGRRPPAVGLPAGFARAATAIARPVLRGPLARIPERIDKYVEDAAVDGTRLQRELGYAPRVGLRDGWERTVRALQAEP